MEVASKTSSESRGSTAIGRFTVEPTRETPRRQTGLRVHNPQQQAAAATAHSASINSNYSVTSSLPAAFKRAFATMSRSLTGQTSATSTTTGNPGTTHSTTAAAGTSNAPEQPIAEAGPLTS